MTTTIPGAAIGPATGRAGAIKERRLMRGMLPVEIESATVAAAIR